MWTKFVFGLAHFFQWTFELIHTWKNWPNYILLCVGILAFAYWFKYQHDHDKYAEEHGTLR